MLHLGTATALLAYFWRDWLAITLGVIGIGEDVAEARRVFVLMVIATIPAVVVGFTLLKFLRELFGSPLIAAAFLIVNGGVLLFGERLRSRGNRSISSLTKLDALVIGGFQCLALIPGISRSGSTIVGGLLRGIDHEGSAHFSFLIATPIILGATVLEVPKLLHETVAPGVFGLTAIAAVVAGITAYLSTWFLMRYFKNQDSWALAPFAYYCFLIGAVSIGVIKFVY
jgi:undecaprenyl-diphosphatase